MSTPPPGTPVTVAYLSRRQGEVVAVVGTVIDGRYPHLYLHLDTEQGTMRLPLSVVRKVVVTKP